MTLLSEKLSILLNLATTLAGNTNQVKHKTEHNNSIHYKKVYIFF